MINILEKLEIDRPFAARSKYNKKIFKKYKKYFNNISEFLYYYRNPEQAEKERYCKVCGKRTPFSPNRGKYQQYCSLSCSNHSHEKIENLKKRNEEIRRDPQKKEELLAKIRKTKEEKYGDPNFNNIEKRIKTNLLKYGVKHAAQNAEIKKKTAESNLQKWGFVSSALHPDIKKKQQDTLEKRFGVRQTFKSDIIRKKIAETQLKKYGSINPKQRHITNKELLTEEYVKEHFIKDGQFLLHEFCDFFNLQFSVVDNKYRPNFHISVPNKQYRLQTQTEIYEYIRTIYNGIIEINNRKEIYPYELDIYIPEKKLAIEFDGLLYHSYGKSEYPIYNDTQENNKIHLNKTELCDKQGIQLLHIFENEWTDSTKRQIWKSVIKNKIGLTQNRIYARKCEIRNIDNFIKEQFLKENHLQGNCSSGINLGLYYGQELVSVMTFGKSRFNKKYDYELLRFCNKKDIVIVGSASKLLNYFKKIYTGSIISYANRRWSNGQLYQRLGFKYLTSTEPNYFYFKVNENILHNRIQFQKHKLKDLLENYNPQLSETENMYNNNYRKIFDCGQSVWYNN